MKFLQIYFKTLVVCVIFYFLGGWMLFDFANHFYRSLAAVSAVIALVIYLFVKQEDRIEQLENRVKALEEK